ncbi:hypothetical protein [Kordiimonas marina]|uniref:hypothetical protein n=1 Tax=Kordiimonas marina TaxID=2872312 RepID=UPI001FF17C8E|nr:hypothetical protein [Kordiimonas marina]MCJ9428432.1 hypothetical protein [Kordiimonas marina]
MNFTTSVKRLALVWTTLLFTLCIAEAASAETFQLPFGETTLSFELQPGYCQADPQYRFDQRWLDFQKRVTAESGTLLGAFIDCDSLSKLRIGQIVMMKRMMMMFAPPVDPTEAKALQTLPKSQVLSGIAEQFTNGVHVDYDQATDKVQSAIDQLTADTKSIPVDIKGSTPSLLKKTDKGVFAALITQVQMGSKQGRMASMMGFAVVQHHLVAVTSYRLYENADTIKGMLTEVETVVNKVTAANDK